MVTDVMVLIVISTVSAIMRVAIGHTFLLVYLPISLPLIPPLCRYLVALRFAIVSHSTLRHYHEVL